MAEAPGNGSQVLRRANSWVAERKELLALVLGVILSILSGWLTFRDVLRDAEQTSRIVLPDPERPGASLAERVGHIEATRWTPEDEARREAERAARERVRDEAILDKLRELDGQGRAQAAQLAEVREWVRELVGEIRRKESGR